MNKPTILAVILMLLLPVVAASQDAAQLPVRKVVLYKNGMGYFEHFGSVPDKQDVEIALPSAQLNDVLKSLTVIDPERGHWWPVRPSASCRPCRSRFTRGGR